MITERTGTLEVSGGVRLFFRSREVEEARGRLLAVHGLGDHSGRYDRLASCAAEAGLDFFALDLRGHGRSQGRRGHASSFDRLLSDLDRFRRRTGNDGSNMPTVLLGHSLGGLIVGRYVQEFGFPGLVGAVLVTPFVDLAMRPPLWKLRLGEVANRILPSLTLDTEIRSEVLFRTAHEADEYEGDTFVHHRVSARLWGEMLKHAAVLKRRADQSRTPFLVQLAGDDRVVSSQAGRDMAARLAGDTRVIEYEGAYHDLYHDPVAERAVADLVVWLDERLGGGRGAADDVAI